MAGDRCVWTVDCLFVDGDPQRWIRSSNNGDVVEHIEWNT